MYTEVISFICGLIIGGVIVYSVFKKRYEISAFLGRHLEEVSLKLNTEVKKSIRRIKTKTSNITEKTLKEVQEELKDFESLINTSADKLSTEAFIEMNKTLESGKEALSKFEKI
jgi:hypothetical protein